MRRMSLQQRVKVLGLLDVGVGLWVVLMWRLALGIRPPIAVLGGMVVGYVVYLCGQWLSSRELCERLYREHHEADQAPVST